MITIFEVRIGCFLSLFSFYDFKFFKNTQSNSSIRLVSTNSFHFDMGIGQKIIKITNDCNNKC